jgi:hypothetical protein
MLGVGIGLQYLRDMTVRLNNVTLVYKKRTKEEGFTVEALSCVDTITSTFN